MEKCKRMKRQLCMSKSWIYSWLWKSSITRQQYCRSEIFAMKTDIPTNGSFAQRPDGIRIICNTENFVPILVPGLSSSSSWSSSTSRTPLRQKSHSPSSSSSSSSPIVGEIQVREREDAPNSDIYPVQVSNLVGDRSGRPDENQANETPKNCKKRPRWNRETHVVILRSWNDCKNSGTIWRMMKFHYREALTPVLLMKPLQSRLQRNVRIWVNTMFILISLKTEIARSVNGPKLHVRHAENAMAKSYFVLTNLVTW